MSRRPRLVPAIARARTAVRQGIELLELPPSPEPPLLLVALSGGADSLALAAATAFEAERIGWRAGAVIVDHGLQPGSAEQAERAAGQARALGLDPVRIERVQVGDSGGLEAAARTARYAALDRLRLELGAAAVLLGHTLDDQAETVLLGLARGSGAASLQGMPPWREPWLRPLLGLRRSDTEACCAAAGLEPWQDPHNDDPAFTRVRVRQRVLPVLEAELGPGVAEALARTAEILQEESGALDAQMLEFIEEVVEPAEGGIAVSAAVLAANPPGLRHRIIRYVVLSEFGVSLHRDHTLAVARLVTHWRGQDALDLPGIRVVRQAGRIFFTTAPHGHPLSVVPTEHAEAPH